MTNTHSPLISPLFHQAPEFNNEKISSELNVRTNNQSQTDFSTLLNQTKAQLDNPISHEKNKQIKPQATDLSEQSSSSEIDHALDIGLYEYMVELKEKELRAKAHQQVLDEQGLTEEDYAALPETQKAEIDAAVEERYQDLRRALIEELVAQFKDQLQQALQTGNLDKPITISKGLHCVPSD